MTISVHQIASPPWARPSLRDAEDLAPVVEAWLAANRAAMLDEVRREVERYVNDPDLCVNRDEDGFPCRDRLTGAYYLGDEGYFPGEAESVEISIQCRFLEGPKSGMDRLDDYLSLEVWLRCLPDLSTGFTIFRNTDSSVI